MDPETVHNELLAYTLEQARVDPSFRHQLVVDAWAAQTAGENSKNIYVTFALVGLYLHIEKGFSGKKVQDAHVYLAKKRKVWPHFNVPAKRGEITVIDVMAVPPGDGRDREIEKWCVSVWNAWEKSHKLVAELVRSELY